MLTLLVLANRVFLSNTIILQRYVTGGPPQVSPHSPWRDRWIYGASVARVEAKKTIILQPYQHQGYGSRFRNVLLQILPRLRLRPSSAAQPARLYTMDTMTI